MLSNNIISRNGFLFLLVLQAIVILSYPFFLLCYQDTKYKSMILVLYQMNPPNSILTFLSILLAFQCLVLFQYAVMLTSEWTAIRKRDHSVRSFEDENEFVTQTRKHILNFMLFQFIFNVIVLSIPSRTFAIRSLIQANTDLTLNSQQINNLVILSIFLLFADFCNTCLFLFFIQNVFPIENQIPWSQISPRSQIIQEGVTYMFSIAVALPQYSSYTMYVYAAFTVLSLVALVYTKTYYDSLILKVSNFNQGSIIMSMLTLSCAIQRPLQFRSFYIVMVVLLTFLIICLITLVEKQRKIQTFLKTDRITKAKQAYRWLWAVHLQYKFNSESKPEKLQQTLIRVQNQIKRHKSTCNDSNCVCQKPKMKKLLKARAAALCNEQSFLMLKLYLIEIFLSKLFGRTDSELQSSSKNDIIGLFLIFKWQMLKKNYLCCIYNLLKYHDCTTCTVHECQQFYFLRKLIYNKLSEKQQTDEGTVRFQKMIYFEQSFKSLTQSINLTTQSVNDFWALVNKNQLDLQKHEKQSEKIILSYHKYQSIYKKIKNECGEIMIVERLAWRLNQEILQFEQEAMQNVENLKNLINKQRLHRKAQEDESLQFNFKNYFIIISANPTNFQSILGVSKQLAKLVGYTEEFLLTNKLPVILPRVVDVMHEKIIKSYLRRKTTNLQKIVLKLQWMQRNDGSVVPVSLNIIPKYDIFEGLRLVGIVHYLKKIEVCEVEYSSLSVFTILADVNTKIIHVSENCLRYLNFSLTVHQQDLLVHQFFKDIPENLTNGQDFLTMLDFKQVLINSHDFEELNDKQIMAKVQYTEKEFGPYQILKQYNFLLFNPSLDGTYTPEKIESSGNIFGNIQPSLLEFGVQNQNYLSQHGQTGDLVEQNSQNSDNQFMDLSSMSSNSSGSSNFSSQDAQIGEIKQVFDFNQLPKSLKNYRMKLIAGFFAIIATAIALLVVNVYSKSSFQSDLDALYSEKRIRNNFSSSKLISVLIYATANIPASISLSGIGIQEFMDKNTITDYFITNMADVLSILQSALTDFGQNESQWDQNFVSMFNQEQLYLIYLTTSGNTLQKNMTFQKGMTLFQDDASFFQNSVTSQFVANFNIFNTTSVAQIQAVMKNPKTTLTMRTILANLYDIVMNGSNDLQNQMLQIDNQFINQVLGHSNSVEQILLISTICCCGVILILTTFFLPYFFGVEEINNQMIQFIHKTNKESQVIILKCCRDFSEYIQKNQFLNEEGGDGAGEVEGIVSNHVESVFSVQALIDKKSNKNQPQQQIRSRQDNKIISLGDIQIHQQHPDEEEKESSQSQNQIQNTRLASNHLTTQTLTGATGVRNTTSNTFHTQDRLDSSEDYLKASRLNLKKPVQQNLSNINTGLADNNPGQQREAFAGGKNAKNGFLKNIMIEEGDETLDLKKVLRKNIGGSAQKYKIENPITKPKNYNAKKTYGDATDSRNQYSQDNKPSEEDEESKSQPGKKTGGKKSRQQTSQKTQNTKMMDDEKQGPQLQDYRVLNKQTQQKKFKISAVFYLVSSVIIAFYISMYFYTRNIFNQYQDGYYQYDVFYVRNTCFTENYFLMVKTLLYNQSAQENDTYTDIPDGVSNGANINRIYVECNSNEDKYRSIKQQNSGMYQSLYSILKQIDSSDFCSFLVQNSQPGSFDLTTCQTDAQGMMTQGLEQIIASSTQYLYQSRVSYNSLTPSQITTDLIQADFFKPATLQYIGIYYKYLEWTFRYIQNIVNATFQSQITSNFNSVLAIFLIFIGCLMILFILTVHRLTRNLKIRLLKIRLTFKLIPSQEIFLNKDKLEKLNTHIL